MGEWISVSDRLPESMDDVIILLESKLPEKPFVRVGFYSQRSGNWYFAGFCVKPTHWMPLPELPEVDDGNT